MKKKVKKILALIMVCNLMFAIPVSANAGEDNAQEASSRISVSKYVEVTTEYLTMEDVTQYYYYSYYDHDYYTTLHGLLTIKSIRNFGDFVRVCYQGYCSGSI